MDKVTGGCLCGNVRFEATDGYIGSASAIASIVASIMERCFTLRRYFLKLLLQLKGKPATMRDDFSVPIAGRLFSGAAQMKSKLISVHSTHLTGSSQPMNSGPPAAKHGCRRSRT